jgi:hypothetical protein
MRKEGKPRGNPPPPQKTMHQKKKRQLLGNCVLHSKMIPQSLKLCPVKVLVKISTVCSEEGQNCRSMILSCTRSLMKCMWTSMCLVHCPLYWISAKSQCTLIVTPYDSQTVKLDTKLGKEVLKPKCLNDTVDYSSILGLYGR